MSETSKTAVIGLGSMGYGIAISALRGGHATYGFDVNADQAVVFDPHDELQQSAQVADDLRLRQLGEAGDSDHVRDVLSLRLLLGHSHHRDLRDGVDAVREALGAVLERQLEQLLNHIRQLDDKSPDTDERPPHY